LDSRPKLEASAYLPPQGETELKPKCHRNRIAGYFFAFVLCSALHLDGAPRPPQDTSDKRDVFVAPFSHLDSFWAGTRAETLSRGNKIIARAIDIASQHPEFRFFIESENFLANFVQSHSGTKELADLKHLIKEGRIGIAPNWAEIFISLPSGEVQVGNLLYGKLYAQRVFGVNPHAVQPDDIPGFVSQHPQMLRGADIPFLVMSRMGPLQKSLFGWKSPDGSRVLVWNEYKGGYGWGVHLGLHRDLNSGRVRMIQKELDEVQVTTPAPLYLP
jgi:Glycosyl hydrolases family 38 N-terminal domain